MQSTSVPLPNTISEYLNESFEGLEGRDLDHRRENMLLGRSGPLIDRSYAEALPYQYVRELVKNSIEAKIPGQDLTIKLHPDWKYVAESAALGNPTYRLMSEDDGVGMDEGEVKMFFRSLSLSGGGKAMGLHDNFGMGAKISTMPANPYGVYVMSWKDSEGSMVRLFKGDDGEYGLWRWDTDDGYTAVVDPPDDYNYDSDGIRRSHGTALVFAGDGPFCDTYLTFPGQESGGNKALGVYLNKRFFRFPDGVSIKAWEFVSSDKSTWGASPKKTATGGGNFREILGQKHFLDRYSTASGTVDVTGAKVHWWVIDDDNNLDKAHAMHGAGHSPGYVAALHKDELYDTHRSPGRFRQFGIFYAESRKRVTLIVEPDYSESSGACPNTTRSNLIYLGSKDLSLPWGVWGAEFMAKMPDEVKAVCTNQGINLAGLDDVKKALRARASYLRERILERGTLSKGVTPKGSRKKPSKKPSRKRKNTGPHGRTIPEVQFIQDVDSDELDRPAEFNRDTGTLTLFLDHPIFQTEIKYWCAQYDHLPDAGTVESKVTAFVTDVYAFSLVAKLVHATAFKGDIHWKDDAYDTLLSAESLTMGLLGKVDGETQIRQKLAGSLGKAQDPVMAK